MQAQRAAQAAGPVHGGLKAGNKKGLARLRSPGTACLLDQLGIGQQHHDLCRVDLPRPHHGCQLAHRLLPAQRIRRRQGGVSGRGEWHGGVGDRLVAGKKWAKSVK